MSDIAPSTHNISIEAAMQLVSEVFARVGVSKDAAQSVANALVMAEAEGQVGHGFSRIQDYIAQAKTGKVNATAMPKVLSSTPSYAIVDADHGFAFPALEIAFSHLTEMANNSGCAAISVIRSHHCGTLSQQVERLADAGLVGLMVANSPPAIAPWGASTPLYGTNPIAFSAPRKDAPSLVIDLSLSKVARGKIMAAKKLGHTIPKGWALDAEGNPTTSPQAALEGSMLPIGEAKGTALVLIVEILAAVLGGANLSKDVSSFFTAEGKPPGSGQFLLAFKPAEMDGFTARLEALLSEIAHADGARLPGERRLKARANARINGIDVPKIFIDQIEALLSGQT